MKAIFLTKKKEYIPEVYDKEVMAALAELTGITDAVYTKEDLLSAPEDFSEVELIFSTWGMPVMTEEEIRLCLPKLKCLFYGAGTVQPFARPFLNCGVKVFSAWAANAVPVAEFTVAQIILSNKGYFLTSRACRQSGYKEAKLAFDLCRGNYGQTVGIIGAGMIGSLVIEMLKAYKLKVIVYDPFLSDERAEALGVEKCSLEDLFSRAFTVSNHLANNEQTKGMLGYDLFSHMREGAVFINTGRGAQVVEEDLCRVLAERPDLTALLDVTHPEPPAEGHPFYSLPNCYLTPHIAGSAGDEVARMGLFMQKECSSYLAGEPCRYEVTEEMLKTMA